jgi:hypothetical protein
VKSFPKKPSNAKPAKQISEASLAFGEIVQLPGGVPTSRQFDKLYVKGHPDTEGPPLPKSSLYDR